MLKEGLSSVSADNWKEYENHVIKIEEEMWKRDGLIDVYHQDFQMIIRPFEEGESSDEEDSDTDSDFSDNED